MPRAMGMASSTAMGITIQDFPRLFNQPIRILWAGFETDTLKLQRSGWQLAAEECHERYSIRIAMKHPDLKLYGITQEFERERFGYDRYMQDQNLILNMQYIGHDIKEMSMTNRYGFENFRPINAEPVYGMYDAPTSRSIDDFNLFKPIGKEKEIIVPSDSVSELLDRIHKLQKPKQDEIKKRRALEMRRLNKDANEYELETELVAQISTLK